MQSSYGEELGVGEKIAGRYEVLAVLGKGSHGVVYKARHDILGRIVAIKTLRLQRIVDERSAKRFEREARVACMVDHANIIKVFDFGYTVPEGTPYLVMDFVSGVPLYNILKQERYITPERAVLLFSQVCDGLYHAHQRGVIHRDLKPANIMVIKKEHEPESVRIVDLGVAKIVAGGEEESESITRTGEVCGSPIYLSPEQCVYSPLDARTDIYSLGVCLYESLTGVPPIRGATVYDTIYMHVNDIPKPFKVVARDLEIPARIEEIVMRCLAKRPSDRFETMQEVKQELLAAMRDAPVVNVLPPDELFAGRVSSSSSSPRNVNPEVSGAQAALSSSRAELPGAAAANDLVEKAAEEPLGEPGSLAKPGQGQSKSSDQAALVENVAGSAAALNRDVEAKQSIGLANTISQSLSQSDSTWRVIAGFAVLLALGACVYAFYIQQSVESKLKLQHQSSSSKKAPSGTKLAAAVPPAVVALPDNYHVAKTSNKNAHNVSKTGQAPQTAHKSQTEKQAGKLAAKATAKPELTGANLVKSAGKATKSDKSGKANLQQGSAAMALAPFQLQNGFSAKEPAQTPDASVRNLAANKAKVQTKSTNAATALPIAKNAGSKPADSKLAPKVANVTPGAMRPLEAKLDPGLLPPPPGAAPPPAVTPQLSSTSQDVEIADKYFRQAYIDFEANRVPEAVKSFQKAYDRAPNEQYRSALARALAQCAFMCNKSGDFHGAVTYQQRACDLLPGNEKYRQNLQGYQTNKQRGIGN